ncbi:MAG: capsule biosynthesis GfcC family protein, partial [Gemmatimonadota bacterium]
TVLVTGAVAFEARVPYQRGLSLSDYLRKAGGTLDNGDRGRVSFRYANGEINTTRRVLVSRRDPDVRPGSTIVVPIRPEGKGFDWDNFLSKTLAVLSTLATVTIAASTLGN